MSPKRCRGSAAPQPEHGRPTRGQGRAEGQPAPPDGGEAEAGGRGGWKRKETVVRQQASAGEHPNICVECGKSFAQSAALLAHRRSHGGEKPFACLDCGKSFGLSANLLRHRRAHTGGSLQNCRDCGKEVGAAAASPAPRPPGQKPYKCVDCGKSFGRPKQPPASPPGRRRRREGPGGEKPPAVSIPNTCAECWQSFSQNSDLVKHMRIHTGEKPYACAYCGKSFSRSSHHKRHQRTHAGQNPVSLLPLWPYPGQHC